MMNLFSLHGKWFQDDENRFTANILFFLDRFRDEILGPFLTTLLKIPVSKADLKRVRIRLQPFDDGKIPDAEVSLEDSFRLLIESKIRDNAIKCEQFEDYCQRLEMLSHQYETNVLAILTQTDQREQVNNLLRRRQDSTVRVVSSQWREVLGIIRSAHESTDDLVLREYADSFLREVEGHMYNRIVIDELPLAQVSEVVLTTQDTRFLEMALQDRVFWPKSNFSPSLYVAYYVTDQGPEAYSKKISHVARMRYLWHSVSIREVLESIEEFRNLDTFEIFKARAMAAWDLKKIDRFAIGITDAPIALSKPIPFDSARDGQAHPNILPGRKTSWGKLLAANSLIDLFAD